MNETTFDTLAAAKALREAGFEDRQAEAVAETVRRGREGLATKADRDTLATKADIAEVKGKVSALEGKVTALDGKVTALEGQVAALRVDNAERETRLVRWVVGSAIAIAGVIVTAAGVVVAALKFL